MPRYSVGCLIIDGSVIYAPSFGTREQAVAYENELLAERDRALEHGSVVIIETTKRPVFVMPSEFAGILIEEFRCREWLFDKIVGFLENTFPSRHIRRRG